MKMDFDYMSTLMRVFIESESAHTSWQDVEDAGLDLGGSDNESQSFQKFHFHLHQMLDNELISNAYRRMDNLEDVGLHLYLSGEYKIDYDFPLRLTQKGYDFAAALNNREVLSKLKSELRDAPFKTVFEGGQQLLTHYFTKKIDELTKEG